MKFLQLVAAAILGSLFTNHWLLGLLFLYFFIGFKFIRALSNSVIEGDELDAGERFSGIIIWPVPWLTGLNDRERVEVEKEFGFSSIKFQSPIKLVKSEPESSK